MNKAAIDAKIDPMTTFHNIFVLFLGVELWCLWFTVLCLSDVITDHWDSWRLIDMLQRLL